ncbi:hypothetical protein M9Y10_007707 [Tritrichomonas musculus]|uniref:Uncharacterized protein n=1 Tax=Tritrichomonas musculus TaxID=1915356 RepID=A0ABR2J299_9EUKA
MKGLFSFSFISSISSFNSVLCFLLLIFLTFLWPFVLLCGEISLSLSSSSFFIASIHSDSPSMIPRDPNVPNAGLLVTFSVFSSFSSPRWSIFTFTSSDSLETITYGNDSFVSFG